MANPIKKWARSWLGMENVGTGGRLYGAYEHRDGKRVARDDLPPSANSTVFSCITKTANDVSSMPPLLKRRNADGSWGVVDRRNRRLAIDRLLTRPNPNQTLPQFLSSWVYALQNYGNAFIMPVGMGPMGLPESLYVIPNTAVQILRSDNGTGFYRINHNTQIPVEIDGSRLWSSSEIVHSRINALLDPLVGFSPLYACAHEAAMGNQQVATALEFYKNSAIPGGVLTLPEGVSQEEVEEKSNAMDRNFQTVNSGKTLVVSGAAKFEVVSQTARDQQLVELLGFTSENICAAFHIPTFIITGKGATYSSADALRREYVSSALGHLIHEIEEGMKVLLNLPEDEWLELDRRQLLRLDDAARFSTYSQGIQAGWLLRSEVRAMEDLTEVAGIDEAAQTTPTQNVSTQPPQNGPINPGVEKVAQENEQARDEQGDALPEDN